MEAYSPKPTRRLADTSGVVGQRIDRRVSLDREAVVSLAMTHEHVTVLLTGAAGLLGTWLRRTAPMEFNVIPATHRRRVSASDVVADLRDRDAVASALTTVRPGLVIHAGFAHDHASIVDASKEHRRHGPGGHRRPHLRVLRGRVLRRRIPRSEAARPDPVWDYGRWKAEAEKVVSDRDPNAVIVRLPLIISVDPEDHILADIRSGHENGAPTVWFSDEMRQPAYAAELSSSDSGHRLNLSQEAGRCSYLPGPERLSRYEIADRSVAAVELDGASIVSALTPLDAHRPRDLNLTGDRAKAQIGWCPTPIHASTPASTHERSASE